MGIGSKLVFSTLVEAYPQAGEREMLKPRRWQRGWRRDLERVFSALSCKHWRTQCLVTPPDGGRQIPLGALERDDLIHLVRISEMARLGLAMKCKEMSGRGPLFLIFGFLLAVAFMVCSVLLAFTGNPLFGFFEDLAAQVPPWALPR